MKHSATEWRKLVEVAATNQQASECVWGMLADLEKAEQDAQRWQYVVREYARCKHAQPDGSGLWHLNSPYLGELGKEYRSLEAAIDAEMAQEIKAC